MPSLKEISSKLNVLSAELKSAQTRKVSTKRKYTELNALLSTQRDAHDILQKSSKLLYSNLSIKLGNVITEGLRLVWPEEGYTFRIDFVERRNTIEADLYLEDAHGYVYSPLDATGGGVADLISLLLRITYITLSPYDNVIIADEILKFLDKERIGLACKFVHTLCTNMKFQLIAVTHIPELCAVADAVYKVDKVDRVSYTTKIKS